jgi:hypothetical protein
MQGSNIKQSTKSLRNDKLEFKNEKLISGIINSHANQQADQAPIGYARQGIGTPRWRPDTTATAAPNSTTASSDCCDGNRHTGSKHGHLAPK